MATTSVVTTLPATTAPPVSTAPQVLVSDDFPRTTIELDGEALEVAVADTGPRRQQGLMGVTSLGDLDGMLFVFSDEAPRSFWMKDTLIPLDIAFFDAAGKLVSVTRMVPCTEDPCPQYSSGGPAKWVLEAAAGYLGDLADDAELVVG